MTAGEIVLALDVAAARSLIDALPRCQACGCAPAEVRLSELGAYRLDACASCASTRPEGRLEPLPHGEALAAIETALLRAAGVSA